MRRASTFFRGTFGIIGMLGLFIIVVVIAGCTSPSITVTCAGCDSCKGTDGPKPGAGACPPPNTWNQGDPPPPGAIQINPTGPLPSDAICTFASNNSCSQVGYKCAFGKTCKDTWNKGTGACTCQCM